MQTTVPRMNEREAQAWLGLITVLQLLPNALNAQLLRDSGVTHFEFSVLSTLYTASEPVMGMTELARRTDSTLPRLSHVCSRLEQRGFIERTPRPTDRRATDVRLVTKGRQKLIHAIPGHIALVRSLVIDALSPDQIDALAGITAAIEPRLNADAARRGADPASARQRADD